MPFPTYVHQTLSDFNGTDENPLSENGRWVDYGGWGGDGIRTSNTLGGSVNDDFWASIYAPRVFSDAEYIATITTWNGANDWFIFDLRLTGNRINTPTLSNRTGYSAYFNPASTTIAISRFDNGAETILTSTTGNSFTAPFQFGVQLIGPSFSMWHASTVGGSFSQLVSVTTATQYSSGHLAVGGFDNLVRADNLTAGTPKRDNDMTQFPRIALRAAARC